MHYINKIIGKNLIISTSKKAFEVQSPVLKKKALRKLGVIAALRRLKQEVHKFKANM
jgi:hypothetical protein